MSDREGQPIGVILAGGAGRRIGGAKALVALAGRPLIEYPLRAMSAAVGEVAVVAKADTPLPELPGIEIWIEPDEPRHPLVGIVHALQRAAGRPVLVCAADMPFITTEALAALAGADAGRAPAVIATSDGGLQPQLGRYEPAAAELLAGFVAVPHTPLRVAVTTIGPALLELPDRVLAFNVNTPDDLSYAERLFVTKKSVADSNVPRPR